MQAADQLVTEGGRAAVSLRTVAEQVTKGARGRRVTHTAAFAHVGGQLELLTHVAVKRWMELVASLSVVASERGTFTPADRLVALGSSYRRFAVEHPHHFRLMYDEEIWREVERRSVGAAPNALVAADGTKVHKFRHPELLDEFLGARDAAFAFFVEAVIEGINDGSLRADVAPVHMARAVASLSHGLAMEALDERLPEAEVVPLLELVVGGLRRR